MYEKISIRITNILLKNNFISDSDINIYVYCFQIIISTIVSSVFILIWALLFDQLLNMFIFFLGFFICRKISGGYHAETPTTCFFLTQLIFISFALLITYSNILNSRNILMFTTIFASIVIWKLSPVDNKYNQLSNKEKIKFQKHSRLFSIINILLLIFAFFHLGFYQKYFCYILGVTAVSIMLILGKIKNLNTMKGD